MRVPNFMDVEIRGTPARYTHSLVTAVSGLHGAATLADQHAVSGDATEWRRAAAAAASGIGGDGRPLPEILMVDLRHGDVELVPQTVLQTLHDVPLLFERMRSLDPQFQGQYADCRHVLRRKLR